jgi:methionyl aminopeptidase
MPIPIKTPNEIELMRQVCRGAALVLKNVAALVRPGISTFDLDTAARDFMSQAGVESACRNYKTGNLPPFPGHTCISVNETVVHGVPTRKRILQSGDIVTLDVVVRRKSFVGDNARTFFVGDVAHEVATLCKVTEEALYLAIDQARPGNRVHDISHAVERHIRPHNYGIIDQYTGHGVGRGMHEDPQIPNAGTPGTGALLRPGMTLAIEPMIALGTGKLVVAADRWTANTRDGKPSAHYEHTVLVTENEPEILTRA